MSRKRAATARATVNASANVNARRLEKAPDNNTYRPVPKQKKKKTKKKKATVGCCDVCDAVQCYAIAVGTMEDPNG